MPYIQVDNDVLTYRLRRSPRAKHLHIRAVPFGFEIVAPFKIKNQEIVSFAWRQRNWMQKIHSKKVPAVPCSLFSWPFFFLANETIPYRGKRCTLQVKYGECEAMHLIGNTLVVTLSWYERVNEDLAEKLKRQIFNWYQQQSMLLIKATIARFCPFVGAWPKNIKIKQQKTRWGSCSPSDTIYINWLLILAPIGVLEYVVLHELCHLIHRNHGKRFWAKVEKCWPDYVPHYQWLKQHGHQLQEMQLCLHDPLRPRITQVSC